MPSTLVLHFLTNASVIFGVGKLDCLSPPFINLSRLNPGMEITNHAILQQTYQIPKRKK